jgi:hypothetical protein
MLTLVAMAQAPAKAREGADEELFRENAPKFHLNFSVGEFDRNGLLLTPDIEVDSIRQIRRPQKLCKTDSKFNVTFPGMQLRDLMGNVAAVITSCRPNKGPLRQFAANRGEGRVMGPRFSNSVPKAS